MAVLLSRTSDALRSMETSQIQSSPGPGINRRRVRRGSDQWIPQVLDNFCPWADCKGLLSCPAQRRCGKAPGNFTVHTGSNALGDTCYTYTGKTCKEAPKEDNCACLNNQGTLRMGYKHNEGRDRRDAPIRDRCAQRQTRICTTTTAPSTTPTATTVKATTAVETTTSVSATVSTAKTSSTVTSTGVTTTISSMNTGTTTPSATSDLTPAISKGINNLFIWPPLLVALVLILLLVALYRKRRRPSKTPAHVTSHTDTGLGVSYSAVNADGSPDVSLNRDAAISNPSYERDIIGNELERSGDFFCPKMLTIPSGQGKLSSPRYTGEDQAGNAAASHGNHNVAFSDGNYYDVDLDAVDDSAGKPPSSGTSGNESARGSSRYEPHSSKRFRFDIGTSTPDAGNRQHVDTGYENPDDVVSPSVNWASSNQPSANGNTQSADGYEDAPVFIGANGNTRSADGYEDASVFIDANDNQSGDKTNPVRGNASPAVDLSYEIVSPNRLPESTGDDEYAYAYAKPCAYPAGKNGPLGPQLMNGNQYNILQTPCKENDGEYSMLKRNKGGSGQISPVSPVIIPVNEYNMLDTAVVKQ